MKPKEKASYLIALFEITAHPTIDVDKQLARQSAFKCVDEILKVLEFGGLWIYSEDDTISDRDFWLEVKSELEKL